MSEREVLDDVIFEEEPAVPAKREKRRRKDGDEGSSTKKKQKKSKKKRDRSRDRSKREVVAGPAPKPVKLERKSVKSEPTEPVYDVVAALARAKARRALKQGLPGTARGFSNTGDKSRKRRWGDTPVAPVVAPNAALQAAKELEVAQLRLKIQAKLASVQKSLAEKGVSTGLGLPARPSAAWVPLRLDSEGRQIDEQGNLIVSAVTTTKNDTEEAAVVPFKASTHVDARMDMPQLERKARTFNFVKPGKYVKQGQAMRMKQLAKDLKTSRYEASDSTETMTVVRNDPIPDVEWWDVIVLKPMMENEPTYDCPIETSKITPYIYNPIPLKPVTEAPPPPPMPMFLTEKEKKKIRRMRKLEKERVRQDEIRFALVAAPEARSSLGNFHRTMQDELISNPTTAEAKTREQMLLRKLKHEENNASRALTPHQKTEKRRKKMLEDTSREVCVCVFRTGDMVDGQRRFKIDINAQQLALTGCAVICGDTNVVVAEGGPKATKKFKRLLLHRIAWTESLSGRGDDDEDEEMSDEEKDEGKWNKCVLAWEGISAKRKFKTFSFENCRSEVMARKFFEARQLEHFWDACKNYQELADA